MRQTLNFKQITLITDGCSNTGISPVFAAKQASKNGITVNVIGITERGKIGKQSEQEIEQIAKAGGGLGEIVPLTQIAKTVQMVTRQAINKTINQVVHNQLNEILGNKYLDITSIPPTERLKVAEMVDQISEYSSLKVLLLIDQSASMQNKMSKVQEAIMDFHLSLLSRAGESSISIATFPGVDYPIEIKVPWTASIKEIEAIIDQIKPSGNTPTGPAILESIKYIEEIDKEQQKGVLDEYVI